MAQKKRNQQTVICGTVTPADWSEEHEVSRVWIITDDDKKYEIVNDENGRELLDYPYEVVRAWGRFEKKSGQHLFRVRDFEPLDFDENVHEHWDDDSYY